MNIRLAIENDRSAIESCIGDAYQHYIPRIGKRPASMDREFLPLIHAGRVHVYESKGEILGVMVVAAQADHLEVSSLAVQPYAQRRGIGKRLMEEAEGIAKKKGLRILRLYTNAALPELARYYEGIGYKTTETKADGGYNRVFLQKLLTDAPNQPDAG